MGRLTDYDLVFTSSTRSIRISHIELSHQRFVHALSEELGITFSNITPAEPPSYVPVEFKSANGN
jgi:hypothetical protein